MVLAKLIFDLIEGPLRSVDCFEKLYKIGVGTYGQVFKAREKATGEIVALKKLIFNDDITSLPIPIVREITILKQLDHQNVLKLREIVTSVSGREVEENNDQEGDNLNCDIYMVFDYMDNDLGDILIYHGSSLTAPEIKCCMKQILDGLHYCHTHNVLHRDIKDSNILVDVKGTLKIADFGLCRSFSPDRNEMLTNKVVSLWFKPPELLLGSKWYGPEVDLWSVGCIFGGLLKRHSIMTGDTEFDQLKRIFALCGFPDEENWPGVSKLPLYDSLECSTPVKRRVKETFINVASDDAVDLLENLLTLDPSKRWTAKQALEAPYFSNEPLPDRESLPKYESLHLDPRKMEALKKLGKQVEKMRQENLQMQQQQQQQPMSGTTGHGSWNTWHRGHGGEHGVGRHRGSSGGGSRG